MSNKEEAKQPKSKSKYSPATLERNKARSKQRHDKRMAKKSRKIAAKWISRGKTRALIREHKRQQADKALAQAA